MIKKKQKYLGEILVHKGLISDQQLQKVIEEQITGFYKELKNTTDNQLISRVSGIVQELYALIDKISASLRANDTVNALLNYNKAIDYYNQIPEGFLRYKNSIGARLLEIYRSLSIYSEITTLQQHLMQQPQPQQKNNPVKAPAGNAPIVEPKKMLK